MRSDRASAARSAAACGPLLLAGCIYVPYVHPDAVRGWGAVEPATLDDLARLQASRADVLLRLGEPERRSPDDRYFTYEWTARVGAVGVLGGASFPVDNVFRASIRFDGSGHVAETHLAAMIPGEARTTPDAWMPPHGAAGAGGDGGGGR